MKGSMMADMARQAIKALKDARTARGLTIAEVAEVIGVDKSVISRFENEATDPHVSTLQRYANAVGAELRISIEPTTTAELDARLLNDVGHRMRAKRPDGLKLAQHKG